MSQKLFIDGFQCIEKKCTLIPNITEIYNNYSNKGRISEVDVSYRKRLKNTYELFFA